MNDTDLMQVLNAIKELMEKLAGLFFFDSFLFDDVLKQLSFFHVVGNKE